jgi:hypothetical protein
LLPRSSRFLECGSLLPLWSNCHVSTIESGGKPQQSRGTVLMAHEELLIFQRCYDFAIWLLEHTQKFPKSLRFSLAVRIENRILEVLDSVVLANRLQNKVATLQQADRSLDSLRMLIRLAHSMRVLATNSYEYASQELTEIGKLLGGWLRQQRRPSVKGG